MNKSVSLLDCTLRDGGYINDWNFSHNVIMGTYKRLDNAGVDYIEVGFLDDRREFDINRTITPSTRGFDKIFENIEKKHAIPVAMIDFGTCDISNIKNASESFIEGIRVIFKKEKIAQALPYCKKIKDKGYKLFIQAISITSYSDIEMLEYIQKINEIEPYAFSIVDTYGLLNRKKLTNYFRLMDNNLKPSIKIGYHGHNNFQLAFSNSIEFLATDTKRDLIVDSTVYGMGKSAGNCASELLGMHMNEQYEKNYDVNQFLEILDTDLMAIYEKIYWGYKYNFYLSAMHNCHPNYVSYLLDKKTLTVTAVNNILDMIPFEKKLLYEETFIESLYTQYQDKINCVVSDFKRLKEIFYNREVLLIGPGHTIVEEKEKILEFINTTNPLVISVNFYASDFKPSYVFVSNSKRYSKLTDSNFSKDKSQLIITSNVTTYDIKPNFFLNYSEIRNYNGCKSDSSLILLLAALNKMNVNTINLAGFDGFSENTTDYYQNSCSFGGNSTYNIQLTEIIKNDLHLLESKINFNFITKSIYQGL